MSIKAVKLIIFWLIAEAVIWIPYRNIISYDKTLMAILYFLFFSFITIILFKDIFKKLVIEKTTNKYLFIVGSLAFHGFVYWFCNTYLNVPLELINSSPASYTLVNSYFLFGKPFDILIQQLMLIVLVNKLNQEKVSLRNITLITAIIFGVAHLESLRRMELTYSLILTSAAILMSIVVPRFILKVKNGYIYNVMIHLAFVDIAALMFWSLF